MSDGDHVIKILKGTIVKYDGHPIRLAESILINIKDSDNFKVEKHKVLLEEDVIEDKEDE